MPTKKLVSAFTFLVFLVLDFLDTVLCIVFRCIDKFSEGQVTMCYCQSREDQKQESDNAMEDGGELSETLFERKNIFREMGFLRFSRKWKNGSEKSDGGQMGFGSRWSHCGCESCVSWLSNVNGGDDRTLYVCVRQPSQRATHEENGGKTVAENVVFLHGFLSSSSWWTETVFQHISKPVNRSYRLFAVDLLGFGRSPRPRDCFYTVKDHLEMIEKSVIIPFQLESFHLVAHSMGCIIAIALAANYSKSIKSITLVAPPVFPSEFGAKRVLEELAKKKIWPPLLFGSAVISWYEHIGRTIFSLVCRFHKAWEKLLKLLLRREDLHFMIMNLARHTHHSAWHSLHNVLYGGNELMERCLRVLSEAKVKICVVHGDQDKVIPVECSENIKRKAPNADIEIIKGVNHSTIIVGREKEFTRNLERIWASQPLFDAHG